jgi:hypothetical protein
MRIWDPTGGVVTFIGLNPSTADAVQDDATIRVCVAYARRWGFGGICMLNLFAFRARKPKDMLAAEDPVGPENDYHIEYLAARSTEVIAAWGAHGKHLAREAAVVSLLGRQLKCLSSNKDGSPHHPLYLPANLEPKLWVPT